MLREHKNKAHVVPCHVYCTPASSSLPSEDSLEPTTLLLDFFSVNLSNAFLNLCELLESQTSLLYRKVPVVWIDIYIYFLILSLQFHLMFPGSCNGRKSQQVIQKLLTQAILSKCHISLCLLPCICITELSASLMLFKATSIFGSKSIIFCLQPKSLLKLKQNTVTFLLVWQYTLARPRLPHLGIHENTCENSPFP